MKIILVLLVSVRVASAEITDPPRPGKSASSAVLVSSCGAQIPSLSGWIRAEKKLQDPVCYEANAGLGDASLIVMKATSRNSCVQFLNEMDQARGKNNLISAEKRATPDAGAVGEYELSPPKVKMAVRQKSRCYKVRDEIRIVTFTMQKNRGSAYEPQFEEFLRNFKIVSQ